MEREAEEPQKRAKKDGEIQQKDGEKTDGEKIQPFSRKKIQQKDGEKIQPKDVEIQFQEAIEALECPWIVAKGAREPEEGKEDLSWEEARDLEPLGVQRIMGIADLESSKKQVRMAVKKLWQFMKQHSLVWEEAAVPKVIVLWLQHMLKTNRKIRRITTLMQYARMIQSVTKIKILQNPFVRKYFKGLSRLQEIRPRNKEVASESQYSHMLEQAEDPWLIAAIVFLGRAGARLSDIRRLLGGGGRIVGSLREKTIELELSRRKTDQTGAAPAAHLIGPVKLQGKEETALQLLGQVFPKQAIRCFLNKLQTIKKNAGIQNIIALRRFRARTAALRHPIQQVAKLLGHRPGSRATAAYVGAVDGPERKKRLEMTV